MTVEAYRIGVNLVLEGNPLAGVEALTGAFRVLNAAIETARNSARDLSAAMTGLGGEAQATARAWQAAAQAMDEAAAATQRAAAAAAGLRPGAAPSAMPVPLALPAPGAPAGGMLTLAPPGGGGGGGAFPMAFPGAPGGRGVSSYDYALAAAGFGSVGHAGAGLTGRLFREAAAYGHIETQLTGDSRVTPADLARAREVVANATRGAPGTTLAGNYRSLVDLKSVTGGLDDALAALPAFARFLVVMQGAGETAGLKQGESQVYAMARAMELLGKLTDQGTHKISGPELQRNLDMAGRVVFATGGRVSGADFLNLAKQGRTGAMMLSDDALFGTIPSVIQTMGGFRAGTALMSTAQTMLTQRMTETTYNELKALGLVDPRLVTRDNPNGLVGANILRSDPVAWIGGMTESGPQGVMTRAMSAAGFRTREEQLTAITGLAQRSTVAGLFADIYANYPAIMKDRANILAMRPDLFTHVTENDPAQKLVQMQTAFSNLLTVFGGAAMADMVKVMDAITSGLNGLAEWGRNNPNLARIIVDTTAALGGLAVALGTVSAALFLMGPMIRVLGAAPGVAAGAAAGARGGVAGMVIGGAAGAAGVAGLESMFPTPEITPAPGDNVGMFDRLRGIFRGERDWLFGRPITPPPPPRAPAYDGPVPVIITNPRQLVDGVSLEQARRLGLPPAGPGGLDFRGVPLYPGVPQ